MKKVVRHWGVPCVVFSCLLLSRLALPQATPPAAEEILDYHSDIRVQEDTSLLVQETIRVRSSGQLIKHGIYRDFPTRYQDRLGNRYLVKFQVLEVRRDGQPDNFHLKDLSNGERVYVGNENVLLSPGEYTYTLLYTSNRQLGFFADHAELYWNVTGNGWAFPIMHASATVTLPELAGRCRSRRRHSQGRAHVSLHHGKRSAALLAGERAQQDLEGTGEGGTVLSPLGEFQNSASERSQLACGRGAVVPRPRDKEPQGVPL